MISSSSEVGVVVLMSFMMRTGGVGAVLEMNVMVVMA